MATKKAASNNGSAIKKPTTTKPRTAARPRAIVLESNASTLESACAVPGPDMNRFPDNVLSIAIAELIGTFVLTLVALLPMSNSLSNSAVVLGSTFALLVLVIGNVSGAHINPAITFGLLTMHRLKPVLAPLYWVSQLLGVVLAIIVINAVAGNSISLSFDNIGQLNWSIFGVELVGTAILLFGVAAAMTRPKLTIATRALTIGGALFVGLLVSGSMLSAIQSDATNRYQEQLQKLQTDNKGSKVKLPETPEASYVRGATLNPAIALVISDKTKNEVATGNVNTSEQTNSRLTLEVILGTLAGATLGGNLYILLAGRRQT